MDLSDESAIRRIIRDKKPDLIINPAAYTEVDLAETEKDLAFAINEKAPLILAEEAKALNIPLIHFSQILSLMERNPLLTLKQILPLL